jgi:hypothetical protein
VNSPARTPAIDTAHTTARLAHEASEAIPTLGGQTICTNCAYDLAIDASEAWPTSGSACHTNWCIEGEAQEALGTTFSYAIVPCISGETQEASNASNSRVTICFCIH